ncbi:LOW QUALITY PROTEIN: hypothetical protein PanWU01x14_200130 [Parasponia andersonii]|uniref:Uncharacterized protein n=1 Tax=Parasponia andersonii TaxID=3476 RepID=A0A2P5BYK5_PARAD|nr:LOW QUALITY PROTEIN: hypothetical protein PanWU01x14_200130 [Parasponia andersonii]
MEGKESFKHTQTSPSKHVNNEMPPKQNPRQRSGRGPDPNNQNQQIYAAALVGARAELGEGIDEGGDGEVDKCGDEEDPGGVATWKGEVVGGDGGAHGGVVVGTRAADELRRPTRARSRRRPRRKGTRKGLRRWVGNGGGSRRRERQTGKKKRKSAESSRRRRTRWGRNGRKRLWRWYDTLLSRLTRPPRSPGAVVIAAAVVVAPGLAGLEEEGSIGLAFGPLRFES